jgi:hypothetical protein
MVDHDRIPGGSRRLEHHRFRQQRMRNGRRQHPDIRRHSASVNQPPRRALMIRHSVISER